MAKFRGAHISFEKRTWLIVLWGCYSVMFNSNNILYRPYTSKYAFVFLPFFFFWGPHNLSEKGNPTTRLSSSKTLKTKMLWMKARGPLAHLRFLKKLLLQPLNQRPFVHTMSMITILHFHSSLRGVQRYCNLDFHGLIGYWKKSVSFISTHLPYVMNFFFEKKIQHTHWHQQPGQE